MKVVLALSSVVAPSLLPPIRRDGEQDVLVSLDTTNCKDRIVSYLSLQLDNELERNMKNPPQAKSVTV